MPDNAMVKIQLLSQKMHKKVQTVILTFLTGHLIILHYA